MEEACIVITRLAAVLWWAGLIILIYTGYAISVSYNKRSACVTYQREVREEAAQRRGKLPPTPCEHDSSPGAIVPTCDLPDDVVFEKESRLTECRFDKGWMIVGLASLSCFVVAFVVGGTFLRPPKLT